MKLWIVRIVIVVFIISFIFIASAASDKNEAIEERPVHPEIGKLLWNLELAWDEDVARAAHDELVKIGASAVKPLSNFDLICSTRRRVLEFDYETFKEALLEERRYQLSEEMRSKNIYCKMVEPPFGEDVLKIIIRIPKRMSKPRARQEYLKKAEQLLNKLELFDSPIQLSSDKLNEAIKKLNEAIKATAQAYYTRHQEEFTTPENVKARHIILRITPDTDKAKVKAKAKAILRKAKTPGANFEELAKEYSEGPNAPQGGDLGIFTRGGMVPEFEEAVFNMQPGEISNLVETVYGFHIIKLEEKHPATVKPYNQARPEIIQKLLEIEWAEVAREINEAGQTESLVMYSMRLNPSGFKKYSENYSKNAIEQALVVLRNHFDAFPDGFHRKPLPSLSCNFNLTKAHFPLDVAESSKTGMIKPSIQIRWETTHQPRIIIILPAAISINYGFPGQLEFKLVKKYPNSVRDTNGRLHDWIEDLERYLLPDVIPEKAEIRYDLTDRWYILEKPVLLDGSHIISARAVQEQDRWVVLVHFDPQGRRKFARITGDYVGYRLAIVLDDIVQCAPNILTQISGDAQIEGNFTSEEATYLANILKAGSFPVGFRIAEERTVGPIFGSKVRSLVVSALGGIGDVRALPVLKIVAKNDTDIDVRNKAEEAIRKIKAKNAQ